MQDGTCEFPSSLFELKNHEHNLAIRGNVPNARGTIHPTAISRGFSIPLDPTEEVEMEKLKAYLEYEILSLEQELKDLTVKIDELKLSQQYKKGRLEADKASLNHLLKEIVTKGGGM